MPNWWFASGRHAGVLVPLFSIPSRASWGIGEIPDLTRFARWLASSGLEFVLVLPVNEMQEGESSPYSALSAMAIDPIFIAMEAVEDFMAAGGNRLLGPQERESIDAARSAGTVAYGSLRPVKTHALRLAYRSFMTRHWATASLRAKAFRAFTERERWWLADYALFRALHDEHQARYWIEWEPELRNRDAGALAAARERLEPAIRYYEYLQWLADEQWQQVRRECGPIALVGDFPFMVSGHSSDVWARQQDFDVEASVGVPPDAFSETGQNWGLPAYRWEVIASNDYEWLRDRARRCAELYDGFRVDHLVGFYRTFIRKGDIEGFFVPADEAAQLAQGETLLRLFSGAGLRIFAEDLGTVPDFVRASLTRLGVAGMKVMRWERQWAIDGQPFRDPLRYPSLSVATTGTHDTETLAEWWDEADRAERQAFLELPALRDGGFHPDQLFCDDLRDAILSMLLTSGSDLRLAVLQDLFGWRDRINTPASINAQNWTWRLPWPVEDLVSEPNALERARFLRGLTHTPARAR
jgi:4-alpha-glucanotransferase